MSDETDMPGIPAQIAAENKRLAIDLSEQSLPLDVAIRSTALTLATRHCGDTTVKEGNLYQQLKMDNKLAGPLTVNHVIHAALIFERFLWGEWSKGLANGAMANALDEAEAAIGDALDEPPTRPHGGGDVA